MQIPRLQRRLAGKIPSSGVYKRKRKCAVLAEEDVVECSEKTNLGILAGAGSCGDAEADRELCRVTREELDRGWIHGPLPQTVLGPGSSLTRRFPVVQGRKIRPIDDFTASLINLTNSSQESVGLRGAEIIAASLVQWFSSCHALGVVDTDLKVQSWDLALRFTFWRPSVCECILPINEVLPAGSLSQKHGQRLRGADLRQESSARNGNFVKPHFQVQVICYFAGMQGGFDVAS